MTVFERNGRWGAKAWDKQRRRYIWLGTRDTKEAAEALCHEHALRSGESVATVAEWGRIWLSDYSRPAAATRMVYRQAVSRITKDLGELRLSGVDRRTARAYAQKWPRNISAVARTMWKDAVEDEVTTENPWTSMGLKQSRGRKDIRALTESEVHELADLGDDEMRAVILTLAYVGLRPGELHALRWRDLDLEARRIHVRRSRDVTGVEKSPKNNKTRRVMIPPPALDAIKALPQTTDPDAHVFRSYRGKRLTKGNLHYRWRPIQAKWEAQGHKHLDLYSLRHAAATMRLERGLSPSDVAIQLGHEDGGQLVMSTYGHPDRDRALERNDMAFGDLAEPQRTQERSQGHG